MRIALSLLVLWHAFGMNAQNSFPEDWVGDYAGKMILGYLDGQADTIDVELEIKEVIADSVWTHKMIYRSSKFGDITKDYLIRIVRKGDLQRFVLDEQNGIVMPLTYLGDCFYGTYDVMEMKYINSMRKMDSTIIFDLFAGNEKSKKTDVFHEEGEEDFVVDSYSIELHQTAFLHKK